jgi:hypothetical protein
MQYQQEFQEQPEQMQPRWATQFDPDPQQHFIDDAFPGRFIGGREWYNLLPYYFVVRQRGVETVDEVRDKVESFFSQNREIIGVEYDNYNMRNTQSNSGVRTKPTGYYAWTIAMNAPTRETVLVDVKITIAAKYCENPDAEICVEIGRNTSFAIRETHAQNLHIFANTLREYVVKNKSPTIVL